MRKSTNRAKEGHVEANLIPILSVMFLLIPALLLAMEIASFAAVNVTPPRHVHAVAGTDDPEPEALRLKVFIAEDGFRVTAAGQQQGATAGRDADRRRPTIPALDPAASVDDASRFDYAALGALARRYKDLFPDESIVTVSAENHIPLQALVATLDALRGEDCELRGAMLGERVPPECMFWDPVVDAGAS